MSHYQGSDRLFERYKWWQGLESAGVPGVLLSTTSGHRIGRGLFQQTVLTLAAPDTSMTAMADVTLRPVDQGLFSDVVALQVTGEQADWVASNQKSLAQAATDPALTSYAVFDGIERGMVEPASGPVGFALLEVVAGVGFIQRVMIDERYQRRGYGRALVYELVRRLRLHPDVEMIAVSHRDGNEAMARLLASVGFIPWATPWTDPDPEEVFLRLPVA